MITEARSAGPAGLAAVRRPPLKHYISVGRARGVVWTPLRREVLRLLWRERKPSGPYGLADDMKKAGRSIYPNSLYRVLSVLEEAGLIVSITSSRRVLIAPDPDQRDWAVLHCSTCEHADLIPFTRQAAEVREAAHERGHAIEQLVIECLGRCRSCDPATEELNAS